MAVEFPFVATTMTPFGGPVPTTDSMSTDGGVFKIDAPMAIETPCVMVSIATTKETAPMIRRNQFAGVQDLPDDNLNQPF